MENLNAICVITLKNAVLIYFGAKASSHAWKI
jgi:hypothetical protein